MDKQREESLRKAISYCIENFDVNKATSRLIQFIKDEQAINVIGSAYMVNLEHGEKEIVESQNLAEEYNKQLTIPISSISALIVKAEQMQKENEFMLTAANEEDTLHYYKGIEIGINRIIKLIKRH